MNKSHKYRNNVVLNYIWIGFFAIAFLIASVQLLMGNTEVFPAIINSTFENAKTAFEISLGLTGVLSLWMGIMKIGERGGLVTLISRLLSPIFSKLFPDIPKGHPVTGSIFMNLAANMLGLDNAATPLGLKAMEGLQELNPKKDTASNPMIMFLVLNTSGLTLIPISIMVYRAQMGAANPADVFLPLMMVSVSSYLTVRLFDSNNIYAVRLAQRGELITHHKDQAVLTTLDKKDANGNLISVDDNAICIYEMSGGAFGTMTASWTYYAAEDNTTVIYGTKGELRLYDDPKYSVQQINADGTRIDYQIDQIQTNDNQTASGIIDLFVDCLVEKKEPEISGANVLHAMKAVFASIESSAKGRVIEVK